MWHKTHSVRWTFPQNFSSLALSVWDWQCFEYISTNHDSVKKKSSHFIFKKVFLKEEVFFFWARKIFWRTQNAQNIRLQTTPHNEEECLNQTYTLDQVLYSMWRANMETDIMCWVQDDYWTEKDKVYCLGWWFQTDTRLSYDIYLESNREKEAVGHHLHSLLPF